MNHVLAAQRTVKAALASYDATYTPWCLAGGVSPSICKAAYQPYKAASLAASYINILNPGTDDAALGVAPTLASDGWDFSGTQYLKGPTLTTSDAFCIVRVVSRANIGFYFGTLAGSFYFRILAGGPRYSYGSLYDGSAVTLPAIFGIGKRSFANGSFLSTLTGASLSSQQYIGAANNSGSPSTNVSGKISHIAWYTSLPTDAQVTAITNAIIASL